jgi:hypothetical protein
MTKITYTGILSGRPRFEMSDEDEMRTHGLLPAWLIKGMDDEVIRLDGETLVVGSSRFVAGEQFSELDL